MDSFELLKLVDEGKDTRPVESFSIGGVYGNPITSSRVAYTDEEAEEVSSFLKNQYPGTEELYSDIDRLKYYNEKNPMDKISVDFSRRQESGNPVVDAIKDFDYEIQSKARQAWRRAKEENFAPNLYGVLSGFTRWGSFFADIADGVSYVIANSFEDAKSFERASEEDPSFVEHMVDGFLNSDSAFAAVTNKAIEAIEDTAVSGTDEEKKSFLDKISPSIFDTRAAKIYGKAVDVSVDVATAIITGIAEEARENPAGLITSLFVGSAITKAFSKTKIAANKLPPKWFSQHQSLGGGAIEYKGLKQLTYGGKKIPISFNDKGFALTKKASSSVSKIIDASIGNSVSSSKAAPIIKNITNGVASGRVSPSNALKVIEPVLRSKGASKENIKDFGIHLQTFGLLNGDEEAVLFRDKLAEKVMVAKDTIKEIVGNAFTDEQFSPSPFGPSFEPEDFFVDGKPQSVDGTFLRALSTSDIIEEGNSSGAINLATQTYESYLDVLDFDDAIKSSLIGSFKDDVSNIIGESFENGFLNGDKLTLSIMDHVKEAGELGLIYGRISSRDIVRAEKAIKNMDKIHFASTLKEVPPDVLDKKGKVISGKKRGQRVKANKEAVEMKKELLGGPSIYNISREMSKIDALKVEMDILKSVKDKAFKREDFQDLVDDVVFNFVKADRAAGVDEDVVGYQTKKFLNLVKEKDVNYENIQKIAEGKRTLLDIKKDMAELDQSVQQKITGADIESRKLSSERWNVDLRYGDPVLGDAVNNLTSGFQELRNVADKVQHQTNGLPFFDWYKTIRFSNNKKNRLMDDIRTSVAATSSALGTNEASRIEGYTEMKRLLASEANFIFPGSTQEQWLNKQTLFRRVVNAVQEPSVYNMPNEPGAAVLAEKIKVFSPKARQAYLSFREMADELYNLRIKNEQLSNGYEVLTKGMPEVYVPSEETIAPAFKIGYVPFAGQEYEYGVLRSQGATWDRRMNGGHLPSNFTEKDISVHPFAALESQFSKFYDWQLKGKTMEHMQDVTERLLASPIDNNKQVGTYIKAFGDSLLGKAVKDSDKMLYGKFSYFMRNFVPVKLTQSQIDYLYNNIGPEVNSLIVGSALSFGGSSLFKNLSQKLFLLGDVGPKIFAKGLLASMDDEWRKRAIDAGAVKGADMSSLLAGTIGLKMNTRTAARKGYDLIKQINEFGLTPYLKLGDENSRVAGFASGYMSAEEGLVKYFEKKLSYEDLKSFLNLSGKRESEVKFLEGMIQRAIDSGDPTSHFSEVLKNNIGVAVAEDTQFVYDKVNKSYNSRGFLGEIEMLFKTYPIGLAGRVKRKATAIYKDTKRIHESTKGYKKWDKAQEQYYKNFAVKRAITEFMSQAGLSYALAGLFGISTASWFFPGPLSGVAQDDAPLPSMVKGAWNAGVGALTGDEYVFKKGARDLSKTGKLLVPAGVAAGRAYDAFFSEEEKTFPQQIRRTLGVVPTTAQKATDETAKYDVNVKVKNIPTTTTRKKFIAEKQKLANERMMKFPEGATIGGKRLSKDKAAEYKSKAEKLMKKFVDLRATREWIDGPDDPVINSYRLQVLSRIPSRGRSLD